MIDKIIDLICEAARQREGHDLTLNLLAVVVIVDSEIQKIINNLELLNEITHGMPNGKQGKRYLIGRAYR